MTSASTYRVHRHERSRRKAVTVNHTLLRPRPSPHPDDEAFPIRQPIIDSPLRDEIDIDSPDLNRNSQHTRAAAPQQVADEFVQHINNVLDTSWISHLLPKHAQKLPFWHALPFIQHGAITHNDIVRLLHAGCSAPNPFNPQATQPPTIIQQLHLPPTQPPPPG